MNMNKERSLEIEFIRSELVGPARPLSSKYSGTVVEFDNQQRFSTTPETSGSIFWLPSQSEAAQEIIAYKRETPLQRYGVGLLHPLNDLVNSFIDTSDQNTPDSENDGVVTEVSQATIEENEETQRSYNDDDGLDIASSEDNVDFEVVSENTFKPSVMGLSFYIDGESGQILVKLPLEKKFSWQLPEATPYQVNGAYETCIKVIKSKDGTENQYDAWRRRPALKEETVISFEIKDLTTGRKQKQDLTLQNGLKLCVEIFSRKIFDKWLITCVLRNKSDSTVIRTNAEKIKNTLFQTYFEVTFSGGDAKLIPYPEGKRPFDEFDEDEQTLALLYQDASTWAIGHGCAAAWNDTEGKSPDTIFADCMPAVELPSMTPNIEDAFGNKISISMRQLACLPTQDHTGVGWESLDLLCSEYSKWIEQTQASSKLLDKKFERVTDRHISGCQDSLSRIQEGLLLLKTDTNALEAFRLANQAMILQQIASKQIEPRSLQLFETYTAAQDLEPGIMGYPWEYWVNNAEDSHIGHWRAFQIAFLLMNITSFVKKDSDDRKIVDLIWFPTGGGKTEAYLGVASFYMFHQRLIASDKDALKRDGTNVFMRYTLRMLTTQQFQRAASLICAMEVIRNERKKDPSSNQLGSTAFSLGLWIGGAGSPNTWKAAISAINKYAKDGEGGNPLVLTECPWCRSQIGRHEKPTRGYSKSKYGNKRLLAGYGYDAKKPYLKCSDLNCTYGGEHSRLPIEVIDEAIYQSPPSMFIGTADKLAMMARKPESGSLFGLKHQKTGEVVRVSKPPGLIIQDEFHLISGPLGTIYGLYEGVFEQLCTDETDNIPPKIVASTATIRGAADQVKSVYAREELQLFPNPGLKMSDSFFGKYSENDEGLSEGRLYLGIHATGYKSFLTTQVRAFTAALFRPQLFDKETRDPWWTLLSFYNSLRELGGARTLFSSDIDARLKDYSFRYGLEKGNRRYLNSVEELTSRRSQAELIALMDRLGVDWDDKKSIDACLASNIIEVGVDIDRLSLMAVVGQPKSTAQYIQVTGRVGRKWWERPGLILAMYNPAKSRDLSHFEQFHSYHKRLYERVEPTSATPFSVEAVKKAFAGVLLLWVRQKYSSNDPGSSFHHFEEHLNSALKELKERCRKVVQEKEELIRVTQEMDRIFESLIQKWKYNPQLWTEYPQKQEGEYLMLWPGEYATPIQKDKGLTVLSSMRNVDSNARVAICDNYFQMGNRQDGE